MPPTQNRYQQLLEHLFFDEAFGAYQQGMETVEFRREDFAKAADVLSIELPSNLGDVVYSVRFRTPMPDSIRATEPEGKVWTIEIVGRARYAFRLIPESKIEPRADLASVKIPDSTPEVIRLYAQGDEQALLAIVRYNRLIDIFLGLTTYSLQNHLRTTVASGAQIEIDELYVGLDKRGGHHIIPVQAKGGNDKISVVQSAQDLTWCQERFPHLRPRLVSAQFMPGNRVAMFELTMEGDALKVLEERHYTLVSTDEIDSAEIEAALSRGD